MTSSVFNSNNNNDAVMISSLPSPPISNRQSIIKMPAFMLDRAPSIISPSLTKKPCNRSAGGLISDIGSTSTSLFRRQDELRPILYQQQDEYYLPPIQNVVFMNTPNCSPSPPPYYSPFSFIESPSTSTSDEDDLLNSSVRRKGSIASLLNSDPELKQLDEEESKCNYQSHFFDNYSLKRGRPSSVNHIDEMTSIKKKQRIDIDCIKQACQSSISNTIASTTTTITATTTTTTSESTRATKGLRHFSKQVCDKVAKKGITTYNEVADELSYDIQNSAVDGQQKQTYDQKNIRRRVYDALNVLMAMNIIAKDKKVIKWLGIPECYKQHTDEELDIKQEQDQDNLELLNQIKAEELRQNQLLGSLQMLRGSINSKQEKHVQICNLISRNQSLQSSTKQQKIALPFFMICSTATDKNDNSLQIDIQNDNRSATISFQQDQQKQQNQQIVYEDIDILRHISLLS